MLMMLHSDKHSNYLYLLFYFGHNNPNPNSIFHPGFSLLLEVIIFFNLGYFRNFADGLLL